MSWDIISVPPVNSPEILFILLLLLLFAFILKEFMWSIFNLHNTKAQLFLKRVKILPRRKSLSKSHNLIFTSYWHNLLIIRIISVIRRAVVGDNYLLLMVHSEKFLIFFNNGVYHGYQVISELWDSRMRHEKGEHSLFQPICCTCAIPLALNIEEKVWWVQ